MDVLRRVSPDQSPLAAPFHFNQDTVTYLIFPID